MSSVFDQTPMPPGMVEPEPAPDRARFPDASWSVLAELREITRSLARDRMVKTSDRIQAARACVETCKAMAGLAGGIERGAGAAQSAAEQAAQAAYLAESLGTGLVGAAGPPPKPAPWVTKPGATVAQRCLLCAGGEPCGDHQ